MTESRKKIVEKSCRTLYNRRHGTGGLVLTFVLVTVSIMAASIVLIYKLTNYFGFRMKYRSLLLCAIMAFGVNIAAIMLSPYLTRAHYLRLIFLVLAAAAVVTIYNEHLVRGEAEPVGGELTVAEAEPSGSLRDRALEGVHAFLQRLVGLTARAKKPRDQVPKLAFETQAEEEAKQQTVTVAKKPLPSPQPTVATTPTLAAETPPDAPPVSAAPPTANEAKDQIAATATAEKKSVAAPFKPPTVIKPFRPTPLQAEKPSEKPAEEPPVRMVGLTPQEEQLLGTQIENLTSLDEIIDLAYAKKDEGSFLQAAFAYQKALERYRDDSYDPFLAIELGNLYKSNAAYDKAIATYQDALSIPSIADDDAMYQEFKRNLLYLRTVKYILNKHHALATPFADIPGDYRREIEQVFQRTIAAGT